MDEAVGQTLGRYKLPERVGEGGCGVVYVAEQTGGFGGGVLGSSDASGPLWPRRGRALGLTEDSLPLTNVPATVRDVLGSQAAGSVVEVFELAWNLRGKHILSVTPQPLESKAGGTQVVPLVELRDEKGPTRSRIQSVSFRDQENMSAITQVLREIRDGDPQGAEQLLALVYTELKRIAAQKMAGEAPGNTLQPTALVHEAWMRMVGDGDAQFENRAHFFSAAAEAMRRILVDSARRKHAIKRGSGAAHEELQEDRLAQALPDEELLAVDEALELLTKEDPAAASLVKYRYFVGMNMDEAAATMGMSLRSAERTWTYARAWLRRQIGKKLPIT